MFNLKGKWATFSVLAVGLGVLRIASPVLGNWLHKEPPTPVFTSDSIPNTQPASEQTSTPVTPDYHNANANPYQDAQTVINICSRHVRNSYEYQGCLNYGAMLIRQKYANSGTNPIVQPQQLGGGLQKTEWGSIGQDQNNNPVFYDSGSGCSIMDGQVSC